MVLAEILDRHLVAMDAFHSGDPDPSRALWSDDEPVTLFAPGRPMAIGRGEVVRTFERAAARLSDGRDGRFEVHHVEVAGDLGVLAGVEHSVFSVEGGPPQAQSLRVTLVYRREDGAWRLAHRHAGVEP
ncbi:hypothetical protein GCM10023204_22980 [Actinomycetospora succinea]